MGNGIDQAGIGQLSGASREAKHSILMSALNEVDSVMQQISCLHTDLGVQSMPQEVKTSDHREEAVNPCNLVQAIDELPVLIRNRCRAAHQMLTEIQEGLI